MGHCRWRSFKVLSLTAQFKTLQLNGPIMWHFKQDRELTSTSIFFALCKASLAASSCWSTFSWITILMFKKLNDSSLKKITLQVTELDVTLSLARLSSCKVERVLVDTQRKCKYQEINDITNVANTQRKFNEPLTSGCWIELDSSSETASSGNWFSVFAAPLHSIRWFYCSIKLRDRHPESSLHFSFLLSSLNVIPINTNN